LNFLQLLQRHNVTQTDPIGANFAIDSLPCLCYPSARRILVSSRHKKDEGGSR
jgi:hypothetical protein